MRHQCLHRTKKVATNTNVMIALKPVTGTSVCSRCTIKAVASWPKIAPATQACSLHALIILCLQSATAHVETLATGTATAWNRSTCVKLPPMYTCFDTLRSFASWTIIVIRYSVQKWVDAVCKCLKLAVVLRPWKHSSYEKIRENAFASHRPCYLNPNKDAPSICDLDFSDYQMIVLWVVHGVRID